MIVLNKNTKKAQGFIKDREWAMCKHNDSIYSIYDRPSCTKVAISKEIEKRLTSVVYHGGSSFCFTCSGIDKDGNLVILTKSNEYKII